jgi:ribosomal protein S18 acetylase RimI-like enzyme
MLEIIFRKATNKDLSILDYIYIQNMREYVANNYSWDNNLFKSKFHPNDYIVLRYNREIIGFIKIILEKHSLYLAEVQIKKTYQNQGIGTRIIQSILDDNKLNYQRIWLQVLKGNPAIRFYRKLGFQVFSETETHYKMQLIIR